MAWVLDSDMTTGIQGLIAIAVLFGGWLPGPLLLILIPGDYNRGFVIVCGLFGALGSCGFGPTNPFGTGIGSGLLY